MFFSPMVTGMLKLLDIHSVTSVYGSLMFLFCFTIGWRKTKKLAEKIKLFYPQI